MDAVSVIIRNVSHAQIGATSSSLRCRRFSFSEGGIRPIHFGECSHFSSSAPSMQSDGAIDALLPPEKPDSTSMLHDLNQISVLGGLGAAHAVQRFFHQVAACANAAAQDFEDMFVYLERLAVLSMFSIYGSLFFFVE
jgi:hypothetical protein